MKQKIIIFILIIILFSFGLNAFAIPIKRGQFPNSSAVQPPPPNINKGMVQNADDKNTQALSENQILPGLTQKVGSQNTGKTSNILLNIILLAIVLFLIVIIAIIFLQKRKRGNA